MKSILKLFFVLLIIPFYHGQTTNQDAKLWSNVDLLTENDFYIKTHDTANPIKSQISLSWELMGFSVLNKNFNQNVTNKFIKSASVVNPDVTNLEELLQYQQINFDLAEIYARKMRRALYLNKSKLWKGFEVATNILNDHLHEYYKVQLLMDRQTNGGTEPGQVKVWRNLIKVELDNNQQFDYQNTKKIDVGKISSDQKFL